MKAAGFAPAALFHEGFIRRRHAETFMPDE
jgi:hypothetical protein